MPDDCKQWHGHLAEHALRTAPTIDSEFDAHLSTCAECVATLAEFRVTATAMAHTTPRSIPTSPTPAPPGLDARILEGLRQARYVRRTRRAVTLIAGVAAASILLVVAVASLRSSTPSSPTDQLALIAGDVNGDATFQARAWGTQINLTGTGFTPGQHYNVWLEQASGTRISAGTFTGVSDTTITVVLASALSQPEAVAIGISHPDGTLVVRAPFD